MNKAHVIFKLHVFVSEKCYLCFKVVNLLEGFIEGAVSIFFRPRLSLQLFRQKSTAAAPAAGGRLAAALDRAGALRAAGGAVIVGGRRRKVGQVDCVDRRPLLVAPLLSADAAGCAVQARAIVPGQQVHLAPPEVLVQGRVEAGGPLGEDSGPLGIIGGSMGKAGGPLGEDGGGEERLLLADQRRQGR